MNHPNAQNATPKTQVPATGTLPQLAPHGAEATGVQVGEPRPAPRLRIHKDQPEVPGYEPIRRLGKGGMGVVWLCKDVRAGRIVALKQTISDELSPEERMRFRTEAQSMAKLKHPNVVQVYEVDEYDGRPYFTMDYCPGGSLHDLLDRKPQPAKVCAAVLEQLALGMQHAHENGIIHRDLKPANVLLALEFESADSDSKVDSANEADTEVRRKQFYSAFRVSRPSVLKITDFGLAKNLEGTQLTHTRDVMGTPSYMAPEQGSSTKAAGPAADIWSLGVILYEMLTGSLPFVGTDRYEIYLNACSKDPIPPSEKVKCPRDLETICLKCLRKDPRDRYSTAQTLADDMRAFLDERSISARPMSIIEKSGRWMKKNPGLLFLVLSLFVGFVIATWQAIRASVAEAKVKEQQVEAETQDRIVQQRRAELLRRAGDALDGILTKLTADEKISKMTGLEPLHEELFQFYERLLKDPLSEGGVAVEQVERSAIVCRKLGELTSRYGKNDLARQAFERSIDLFRQLLSNEAENLKWKRELAFTLIGRGVLSSDIRAYSEARKELLEARGLLRSVHEGEPNDLATVNRLAETHHFLGEVLAAENDIFGAIAEYRKAIELRNPLRELHAKYPQFRRDLARDYGYLGDVQVRAGQMSEADASYRESHELRGGNLSEEEARKQLTSEEQFQLARSWQNLAEFQLEQRFFDTAVGFAKKSLELREGLVSENKADKLLSSELAQSQHWVADLYLQKAILADPIQRKRYLVEGLLFLNRARARYDELYQFDKQLVYLHRGRAEVRLLLARWKLLEDPPDPQEARKAALAAKDGFRVLTERGSKDGTLHYFLACATAIESEASNESSPAARTLVLNHLRQAEKCDLQKHPQTIREDRALKSLGGDAEFKSWIDSYSDRYFDRRQGKPTAGK